MELTLQLGIIQSISVDLVSMQTKLILKQSNGNGDKYYTLSTLIFTDVAWQDFRDFNTFNCVWGIEFSEDFNDFAKNEKKYLERMRNYFSAGEYEDLKANNSLKYFSIISTAGLDGFVICRNFNFTQTQGFDADKK